MNHWKETYKQLKELTLKERKFLFKEFVSYNPIWHSETIKMLSLVVVYLHRQVDVCEEYKVKKQALNRAVRYYKLYLKDVL